MNHQLTQEVLQEALKKGVREFCICPGARCAPLVYALAHSQNVKLYYWSEERSAAFFALGRIKATRRPVAVVTTSGTAAGELLPATMEAYYLGLPLLLITADRPRRFRGSGAPQAAEQVGLFGCYAHFSQDWDHLALERSLEAWVGQGPAHLNVCFEEPKEKELSQIVGLDVQSPDHFLVKKLEKIDEAQLDSFNAFIRTIQFPLVVVGALNSDYREVAVQFLLNLNAPIYAEAISGLREDSRLAHLRVSYIDKIWSLSAESGYPIDGILRIGGIPTARFWRDLEEKEGAIQVCSISEQPFSGLSWAKVISLSLLSFFTYQSSCPSFDSLRFERWLEKDRASQRALQQLLDEEPLAEPSFFYALSRCIAPRARVYLGNSLPIREWDLAATFDDKGYIMEASRGLNGIDGQISTFLGFSEAGCHNWAIIGDLTALYDMVAPWILNQMPALHIKLVVINNGGAQIFARMFSRPAFQNAHQLQFNSLAEFWKLKYERWESVPKEISLTSDSYLIEVVPDSQATERFWKRRAQL